MPNTVPSFRPTRIGPKGPTAQGRDDTAWRRFINSRAWRKCSHSYLAANPLCVRCLAEGLTVIATQVHHTQGQSQAHAFDPSTFESLCGPCHSAETRARQAAREGGGEGIG